MSVAGVGFVDIVGEGLGKGVGVVVGCMLWELAMLELRSDGGEGDFLGFELLVGNLGVFLACY